MLLSNKALVFFKKNYFRVMRKMTKMSKGGFWMIGSTFKHFKCV